MKASAMIALLALPLLYISQLIYEANRWLKETNTIAEDARTKRLRKALDWTTPVEKPAKRQKSSGLIQPYRK